MFQKPRAVIIALFLALVILGTGIGQAAANHNGSLDPQTVCNQIAEFGERYGRVAEIPDTETSSACGYTFSDYVAIESTSNGFSRKVHYSSGDVVYTWLRADPEQHVYSDTRVILSIGACIDPDGSPLGVKAADKNPNCQLP